MIIPCKILNSSIWTIDRILTEGYGDKVVVHIYQSSRTGALLSYDLMYEDH